MNIINGMPAHALLLHFVLVLVPLTALLEIVCALWPTGRRGPLLWLTVLLATGNMILTPITINAGGWLYDLRAKASPILQEHAERGSTMVYFSGALLGAALVLVALRLVERRPEKARTVPRGIVAVLVLAVAVASLVQIYRVGDAGAQSVWGDELARLKKSHPG